MKLSAIGDLILDKLVKSILHLISRLVISLLASFRFTRPMAARIQQYLERKILVGSWSVEKEGKNYVTIWKFRPDGKVVVKESRYTDIGDWEFQDACVYINWTSKIPPENIKNCHETFVRPIKASGVRGDSWQGFDCVCAHKINDSETNSS